MLRQVLVFKGLQQVFSAQFGKVAKEEAFNAILKKIQKEAFSTGRDHKEAGAYDFYKYRASFSVAPEKGLLFLFVADLSDRDNDIQAQLKFGKQEFLQVFKSLLDQELDPAVLDLFRPTVEKIHKALSPKISLVGFSGVGKTTITCLIKAQEIPMEHVPTITGDIGTIQIGKLSFALWDFAGQEQFSFLWNKFVHGSDAVLIITDSTVENVDKSRFFVELAKQEAPHAHVAAIGNKQDLPGALPIPEIERMLGGIHAYSMVAIDPANRQKMANIIADVLDISAEISPLLKNLLERDQKLENAEAALLKSDFQLACHLFTELSDLCLDLGDDSLSQEFHHKAEKIKAIALQPGQVPVSQCPTIAPPLPIPASTARAAAAAPVLNLIPVPLQLNIADLRPGVRKKHVEDIILNLRINAANVDKYILDLEMHALLEQCPDGEFREKERKALQVKENFLMQITQNQELLKSL